jgi:hypothetical protein
MERKRRTSTEVRELVRHTGLIWAVPKLGSCWYPPMVENDLEKVSGRDQ